MRALYAAPCMLSYLSAVRAAPLTRLPTEPLSHISWQLTRSDTNGTGVPARGGVDQRGEAECAGCELLQVFLLRNVLVMHQIPASAAAASPSARMRDMSRSAAV
jgi:hypothetical protein